MYIVIFTGGSYPVPPLAADFLSQSSMVYTIIAADSGLEAAELYKKTYDIKIDMIVGDMDSLKNTALLDLYPKTMIRRLDAAKDYTDTETALMEAVRIRELHTHIPLELVLIGGGGGRVDHLFGIQRLLGSALSPDYWLVQNQLIWLMDGETQRHTAVVSGLAAGDLVSTFAVPGYREYHIHAEGLCWPLETVDWNGWGRSISNWADDDAPRRGVVLSAERGAFYSVIALQAGISVHRTSGGSRL